MIVRWISLVPPGIVHSHEPMKSSTQAPDSQPLERACRAACGRQPADLGAEVHHPLQQLAVIELDDRRVGRPDRPVSWRRARLAAHRRAGRRSPSRSRPACRWTAGSSTARPRWPSGAQQASSSHENPAWPSRSASSSIVMPRSALERRLRDLPAAVLRPDQLRRRDLDVVEEDLAEVRLAGRLPDRAHLDSRRVACPCRKYEMPVPLGRVGVGAGQEQAPVGVRGAARPQLLAVHDVARRRRGGRWSSGWPGRSRRRAPRTPGPRSRRRGWRAGGGRCSSVPAASRVEAAWWMATKARTQPGRVVRRQLLVEDDLSCHRHAPAPLGRPVGHGEAGPAELRTTPAGSGRTPRRRPRSSGAPNSARRCPSRTTGAPCRGMRRGPGPKRRSPRPERCADPGAGRRRRGAWRVGHRPCRIAVDDTIVRPVT